MEGDTACQARSHKNETGEALKCTQEVKQCEGLEEEQISAPKVICFWKSHLKYGPQGVLVDSVGPDFQAMAAQL